MASGKKQQLAIGTFVILSLVSAAVLISLFGESTSLRETYTLKCRVSTTGGPVTKGAPVRMMGIPVGKVQNIVLEVDGQNPAVLLELKIFADYRIKSSSVVKVEQANFIGDRVVMIYPGNGGDYLQDGQVIEGKTSVNIDEVISQVVETVGKLNTTADDLHVSFNHLNALIGKKEFVDDLHGTASEFHEGAQKFNRLLGTGEDLLTTTKSEIYMISAKVQKLTDTLSAEVSKLSGEGQKVLKGINESNKEFQTLMTQLQGSEKELNQILHDISKGKGSLGRLIEDDEFIEELNDTLKNIRRLVTELRNDPSQVFWGKERQQSQRKLPLSEVEAMVKAGLKPTTIVAQIEACGQKYELSANKILELKNKGFDERVIEALVLNGQE